MPQAKIRELPRHPERADMLSQTFIIESNLSCAWYKQSARKQRRQPAPFALRDEVVSYREASAHALTRAS